MEMPQSFRLIVESTSVDVSGRKTKCYNRETKSEMNGNKRGNEENATIKCYAKYMVDERNTVSESSFYRKIADELNENAYSMKYILGRACLFS